MYFDHETVLCLRFSRALYQLDSIVDLSKVRKLAIANAYLFGRVRNSFGKYWGVLGLEPEDRILRCHMNLLQYFSRLEDMKFILQETNSFFGPSENKNEGSNELCFVDHWTDNDYSGNLLGIYRSGYSLKNDSRVASLRKDSDSIHSNAVKRWFVHPSPFEPFSNL